jgi:hypothetical protein
MLGNENCYFLASMSHPSTLKGVQLGLEPLTAEHIKNYNISEFEVIGGIYDDSKSPIVINNVALYKDIFSRSHELEHLLCEYRRHVAQHETPTVLWSTCDPFDGSTRLLKSPDEELQETTIPELVLEHLKPPDRFKVPTGASKTIVPNLFQVERKTYVAAVVRDYEVKVLDEEKFTSYLPFCKWTTKELRNKKLGGHSKLTNRRKVYWIVCKTVKPPAEIKESQKDILA